MKKYASKRLREMEKLGNFDENCKIYQNNLSEAAKGLKICGRTH